MSEHRIVRFAVIALVAIVLLGTGISSLQHSAWSEGYMMGLIAGGSDGDALSQYVLYNNGRPAAIGGGVGAIFRFGFVLFGLLFIAKMFRMWAWHKDANGDHSHPGRRHGGPWCREDWYGSKPQGEEQQAQSGPSRAHGSPSETSPVAGVAGPTPQPPAPTTGPSVAIV